MKPTQLLDYHEKPSPKSTTHEKNPHRIISLSEREKSKSYLLIKNSKDPNARQHENGGKGSTARGIETLLFKH